MCGLGAISSHCLVALDSLLWAASDPFPFMYMYMNKIQIVTTQIQENFEPGCHEESVTGASPPNQSENRYQLCCRSLDTEDDSVAKRPSPAWKWKRRPPQGSGPLHVQCSTLHGAEADTFPSHGYGSPAMKPSIPPSLALSPGTSDQCCHGHGWPIELRCAAGDPVNSATDLGLIAGNHRALRVAWRLAAQLISQPRRRRSMHLSLSRACAHGDSGPGCALHAWVRIDTPLFGVGLSHFLIVIGDRVSVVTVLSW